MQLPRLSSLLSLSLLSLLQITSIRADTHAIGDGIQLNVHAISNGQTCTPSTITWGYELTNGDLSLQTQATITLYILDTDSAGITSSKRHSSSQVDEVKRMVKRRNNDSNHHSILSKRQSSRSINGGTIYRKLPSADSVSVMDGMFTWPSIDVPSGGYVLLARIDGVYPPTVSRSDPFYIRQGPDASCVQTVESSDTEGTSSTYGDGDDDGSQDGSSSAAGPSSFTLSAASSTSSTPSSSSNVAAVSSSTPSSSPSNGASSSQQDSSSSSQPPHHGSGGFTPGAIAATVLLPVLAALIAAYYFYHRSQTNSSSLDAGRNLGYSTFKNLKSRFSGNGGAGVEVMREKTSSESNNMEKSRENWTEFSGEDLNGPRSLSANRLSTSNDFNEFSDIMIENPPKVYQQPNRHLSALQEEDEFGSIHRSSNYTSGINLHLPNTIDGHHHHSFAPSTLAPSTLDGQIGAPYGYGAVMDRDLDGRRWSDQGEEVPMGEATENGPGGLQRSLSSSSNFSIKRKPVPGFKSHSPPPSTISHNSGYVTPPQQFEVLSSTSTSTSKNENPYQEAEENDTLSPLDTSFQSNSSYPSNGRSSKFQSTWSSSTPGENRLSDSVSVTSSVARRERDEAFAEAYSEAVQAIQTEQVQETQAKDEERQETEGMVEKSPFDDSNEVSNENAKLVTPSTPRVLLPSSPSLTATPEASTGNSSNGIDSTPNHLRSLGQKSNGSGREGENPPTLSVNLGEDKGFRISF